MPAKDSTRNYSLQPLGSSLPWVRAIGGKQFPQPLQLEARRSCRTYLQTLKHSAWHHLDPLCWENTGNNRKHVDYAARTIEPTTLMLHMPWRQILTSSRRGFQWYPRSQDLYSKSTVKQCVLSYREAASIPDPSKSHSKTDCNCSRHLNHTGYWRTTSFDLAIPSAKAVAVGRCAHLCLLIGLSRIQYLKQTFTSWSQTVSANIHWKPFGETLLAKGGGQTLNAFFSPQPSICRKNPLLPTLLFEDLWQFDAWTLGSWRSSSIEGSFVSRQSIYDDPKLPLRSRLESGFPQRFKQFWFTNEQVLPRLNRTCPPKKSWIRESGYV